MKYFFKWIAGDTAKEDIYLVYYMTEDKEICTCKEQDTAIMICDALNHNCY